MAGVQKWQKLAAYQTGVNDHSTIIAQLGWVSHVHRVPESTILKAVYSESPGLTAVHYGFAQTNMHRPKKPDRICRLQQIEMAGSRLQRCAALEDDRITNAIEQHIDDEKITKLSSEAVRSNSFTCSRRSASFPT